MKNIIIATLILISAVAVKAQTDAKTAFNKTLKAYFETKNALAKDNAADASAKAKLLSASFKSFPVTSFNAPQKTTFIALSAEIRTLASLIGTQSDIKGQRKSFGGLSSAMLKLTRTLELNDAPIYVQYCPMVKKTWLNEVEEVQNPFYGSVMYDCGEVTETLAKK